MSAQAALGTYLALSLSGGDFWHRIESLELAAGVTRGKLPGNATSLRVAFSFYRRNLAMESRLVISAVGEGVALENGDLNLGHV